MKITRLDKLTDEKHLNLYAASFKNRGHEGRWVYASRRDQPIKGERRADAVIIVPVLHEEGKPPRLVVIKEFRVPLSAWVYAFPAGLLEKGEKPETAARREMLEETGLKVTRVKRKSPLLFSTAGLTDESIVMVFVDAAVVKGGKQALDQSEALEVLLLDHKAVCRLATKPDLPMDAKVWTIMVLYQQLGRLE